MEEVYWQVGDKKYYNLIKATEGGGPIKFQIDSDVLLNYKWHIEPEENWKDLLKTRAEQIRDKYKRIRLWYSGGSDSHTMLKAFTENNIYIDEIAIIQRSPTNDFKGKGNREIEQFALPYLHSISNLLRKSKINLIKIGLEEYIRFYSDETWIYDTNWWTIDMADIFKIYSVKSELFEDYAITGEILGMEKSRPILRNGSYYERLSWYLYRSGMSDHRHLIIEPFYLSSDCPELFCKQSHLVKNYFKSQDIQMNDKNGGFMKHIWTPKTSKFMDGYYGSSRDMEPQKYTLGKGSGEFNGPVELLQMAEGKKTGRIEFHNYDTVIKNNAFLNFKQNGGNCPIDINPCAKELYLGK